MTEIAVSLHSQSLSLYKHCLLRPPLYFLVQTYREVLRLSIKLLMALGAVFFSEKLRRKYSSTLANKKFLERYEAHTKKRGTIATTERFLFIYLHNAIYLPYLKHDHTYGSMQGIA